MNNVITSDIIKAKVSSLRLVQDYIKELQKLNINDIDEVNKFIESQINNYKQLVKTLNNSK